MEGVEESAFVAPVVEISVVAQEHEQARALVQV